jgi:hypothetical protein
MTLQIASYVAGQAAVEVVREESNDAGALGDWGHGRMGACN